MSELQVQPPASPPRETTVGNYFVANYPPFSFWSAEEVPRVEELLDSRGDPARPFGIYVHLPFCRKRCDFCYFKVYTDKDGRDVARYVDGVIAELALYARKPYFRGRKVRSVYFGGGTPSYLSVEQLTTLFQGLQRSFSWEAAEEVAFECEPGTLQEKKLHALRDLGVTRLSLGVENFDADILASNNRAHRSEEIYRAWEFARAAGFPQINIDLIAGMVGETDENWARCIDETVRLAPESVTIYQMEVPFNTTISQRLHGDDASAAGVADWPTKRRWTGEAFARLEAAGYVVGSAYTAKKDESVSFVYRDSLWFGGDMLGVGVSSFSHAGGVHFQNEHDFLPYLTRVEQGQLPLRRALAPSPEALMVREFILQMKLGHVGFRYFRDRFGVDPAARFEVPLRELAARGFLTFDREGLALTRPGLLRVDELLPAFFLPEHQNSRYA